MARYPIWGVMVVLTLSSNPQFFVLSAQPSSSSQPGQNESLKFAKDRRAPLQLSEYTPVHLFPTSVFSHWVPISPLNLSCPIPSVMDPGNISQKKFPYSLIKSKDVGRTIRGYLCSKVRLVTSCYEGFFGTRTIENRISHRTVTLAESELFLHRQRLGESEAVVYPLPSCGWMKTYTSQKDYTSCVDHPAHYNPILQVAVDSIFDEGECKESPCVAKGGGALWISLEPFSQGCLKGPMSWGWIQKSTQGTFIFGYHIGFYPVPKLCTMELCGRPVVRLPDGVLIDTSEDFKAKECPDNIEVKFLSDDIDSFLLERDIEQKVIETLCLDTIGKVSNQKAASVYDLTHFYPNVPGAHRVYRLNGQVIEANAAFFSWVSTEFNPQLTSHFTSAGNSSLLNGFSGLTYDKERKSISLPYEASFLTETRSDLLANHEIIFHSPKFHHLESLASEIEDLSYTKEVGSLTSQISLFFSSTKIIMILALVLLIIVGGLLLYCFCKRRTTKVVIKTNDESREPMFNMTNMSTPSAPLWADKLFQAK